MKKQTEMPCGCKREDCLKWLRSLGVKFDVNFTQGDIDNAWCYKCSVNGPMSLLIDENLRDFRALVIGSLDIKKNCLEIAKRVAKYIKNRLAQDADYAEDYLDDAGKKLLTVARRNSPRALYIYGDYLRYGLDCEDKEDFDEEEMNRCSAYWTACSAVHGYSRALRELGWVLCGNRDCGTGYFDDESSELPQDDIVSDCCFLAAAKKGDPRAIQHYVSVNLLHGPRKGNEDYVFALKLMGRFANVDDWDEPGAPPYDKWEDAQAIKALHSIMDYGLKESREHPEEWAPWEHPFAVAICSENGWRIKKDIRKALDNYREAAKHGCKAARRAVARLERSIRQ